MWNASRYACAPTKGVEPMSQEEQRYQEYASWWERQLVKQHVQQVEAQAERLGSLAQPKELDASMPRVGEYPGWVLELASRLDVAPREVRACGFSRLDLKNFEARDLDEQCYELELNLEEVKSLPLPESGMDRLISEVVALRYESHVVRERTRRLKVDAARAREYSLRVVGRAERAGRLADRVMDRVSPGMVSLKEGAKVRKARHRKGSK